MFMNQRNVFLYYENQQLNQNLDQSVWNKTFLWQVSPKIGRTPKYIIIKNYNLELTLAATRKHVALTWKSDSSHS